MGVGLAHFFLHLFPMSYPLIPEILDLAGPIAAELQLEIVAVVFHTHQNPPLLRVDIRNPVADTSLDDCERMSRALEPILDQSDLIPEAYVLEVSSPGLSRCLTSDREFVSFRGFPVIVRTSQPVAGHCEWVGNLIRRDPDHVYLNQKGRSVSLPRPLVIQVQLHETRS
jgi:ribosome maturation factor RimP